MSACTSPSSETTATSGLTFRTVWLDNAQRVLDQVPPSVQTLRFDFALESGSYRCCVALSRAIADQNTSVILGALPEGPAQFGLAGFSDDYAPIEDEALFMGASAASIVQCTVVRPSSGVKGCDPQPAFATYCTDTTGTTIREGFRTDAGPVFMKPCPATLTPTRTATATPTLTPTPTPTLPLVERVYVGNAGNAAGLPASLSVIDPGAVDPTPRAVATIGLDSPPQAIAIAPDGTRVYVAALDGSVEIFDAATTGLLAKICVAGMDGTTHCVAGTTHRLAITADGASIFVTNSKSGLAKIDTRSTSTSIGFDLDGNSFGVALDHTNMRAFMTVPGSPHVTIVDLTHPTSSTQVRLDLRLLVMDIVVDPTGAPRAYIGSNTNSVAIAPDGQAVYATYSGNGARLTAFDTGSDSVVENESVELLPAGNYLARVPTVPSPASVTMGLRNPRGVAVSPDGARLYVVNNLTQGIEELLVLDPVDLTPQATPIPVGSNPGPVAAGLVVRPTGVQ